MNRAPKNQPGTALVENPVNHHKQTALHFLIVEFWYLGEPVPADSPNADGMV
jgi:hypothetical protein